MRGSEGVGDVCDGDDDGNRWKWQDAEIRWETVRFLIGRQDQEAGDGEYAMLQTEDNEANNNLNQVAAGISMSV